MNENCHYFMALSHMFYVIKVFSEGQLTYPYVVGCGTFATLPL
jgi:hypothetical protein